jgi:hypothetical protein
VFAVAEVASFRCEIGRMAEAIMVPQLSSLSNSCGPVRERTCEELVRLMLLMPKLVRGFSGDARL